MKFTRHNAIPHVYHMAINAAQHLLYVRMYVNTHTPQRTAIVPWNGNNNNNNNTGINLVVNGNQQSLPSKSKENAKSLHIVWISFLS